MKRISLTLLTLLLTFSFIGSASAVYNDSNIGTYEQELAKFPCDYQNKIKQLHNIYPNAVFVIQNVFYDWDKYKEVPVKWSDMLVAEKSKNRSLIHNSAQASYKTSTCGEYSGSTCVYYVASQSAIEYYMNPYNFLDEKHVFMFESQFNKGYYTENGVERILSNTFMSHKNCPGSNKTYAQVILEASRKHNISAYALASRLKQEQGSRGNTLVSGTYQGYTGIYNYFNIKAGGKTATERITNGLAYAKSQGWTTPYLAIIGGTKFVYEQYVGVNDRFNVKGQMTTYLQKWDPYGSIYGGHQYMQNIVAPYSESVSIYNAHALNGGYRNNRYVFHIPIFTGAPNTTNNSCNAPTVNNTYKKNNGYMSGINNGTTVNNVVNDLKGTVTDKNGKTKTGGKIGTGDKVTVNGITYTVVIYGDISGDGDINKDDCLAILRQINRYTSLKDSYKEAADANHDGKINKDDCLAVLRHINGYTNLNK